MNPALYQLSLPEGTRLTLARLYDDVDQDDVRAWDEWKEGRPAALPPFCWRLAGDDYKPLMEALRRGRTAITDDLAALTKIGVIRRAKRDGRSGWELLGMRRPPSAQPDPDVRPAGRTSPNLLTRKSAQPDVAPPPKVRPAGPGRPPSRTNQSAQPDPRARAISTELINNQRQQDQRDQGREDPPRSIADVVVLRAGTRSEKEMEFKKAKPADRSPAESRLIDLANEIGRAFVQLTAEGVELRSSRIRATDDVLDFLRALIVVPDASFDEQLAVVRAYVLDYAEVCRGNGLEAQRWRPNMLCSVRRADRSKSAWEMLLVRVDEWRVARDLATKRQRDAEAKAEADAKHAEAARALQAKIAAGTWSPEVSAEANAWLSRQASSEQQPQQLGLRGVISRVASPSPRSRPPAPRDTPPELTGEDEERVRRQGRWREHQQLRAETDDLEARRARNRRMVAALQLAEKRGRPLTQDEIRILQDGPVAQEGTG